MSCASNFNLRGAAVNQKYREEWLSFTKAMKPCFDNTTSAYMLEMLLHPHLTPPPKKKPKKNQNKIGHRKLPCQEKGGELRLDILLPDIQLWSVNDIFAERSISSRSLMW